MPIPDTDIHFPKAGIHVAGPYGQQPSRPVGKGEGQYVRTTADGVNVVSFDPVSGRDRGGSRTGLSKFINATVAGETWVVQNLATLVSTNITVPIVQQNQSGRVVYLLAVSKGLVKWMQPDDTAWTATTNNTGQTPPLNVSGVMQSTSVNQKQFFCDGNNYVYFNPPTNSIELWTPTSGSMPRDSENNAGRLICTYRGRASISGLRKDPQNIFFAKVGDPFNFEYAPNPDTVTKAVAMNLSPLGLIGDIVTALIPYTDDLLIVGGDHTIFVIRGDPAFGGSVDRISDITGIAFGSAWCKDPYGNVYFFGSKPSIWRMASGTSKPERISQPIEPLLAAINTGTNLVNMVWNDRQQSVELYITADDAPAATTHFVWESRTNSWFKKVHANTNHNPLCVVAYDGNDANDRVVCVGCWDGYVRFLDHTASTDDGTNIASYVLLGPILTPRGDEMILKEIQWVLGESSGDITWEVLAGDTAESALAAAAKASGTAVAGRNDTEPIRVANHAIYIKISATTRWAMESVRTIFTSRGTVRKRKP